MTEQGNPNPQILCLGTPQKKEKQYNSPTIGEITLISSLTEQKRDHYKVITRAYKYLCGSLFLLGSSKVTEKVTDSNLNSIEGLRALAIATISFGGYYYSRIRETAFSYFKEA